MFGFLLTRTAAIIVGTVALTGAGAVTATEVVGSDESVVETLALSEGQYLGPCSIVTPPEPDPCEAAQGTLRYHFWAGMVNADQFKKWKQSAPKDYLRLQTLMAAPMCSTPAHPQPQIMVTKMGAALAATVGAYACAKGTEPIVLPTPNPIVTGTDKIPPSAPGAITVGG